MLKVCSSSLKSCTYKQVKYQCEVHLFTCCLFNQCTVTQSICLSCMNVLPPTYTAGDDYIIGVAPFTATFAPGETTATVLIPIRDDSVLESKESFDVLLSIPEQAASLGVRAGNRNRSTVWIDDDDSLVVVFDPITYIVNEHEGPAKISLKANATASFEYAVLVDTSDVSAKGEIHS